MSVSPPQRAHSDKKRAWQDILTRHGIKPYTVIGFSCSVLPQDDSCLCNKVVTITEVRKINGMIKK